MKNQNTHLLTQKHTDWSVFVVPIKTSKQTKP